VVTEELIVNNEAEINLKFENLHKKVKEYIDI
jgi:hypothetical protein